MVEKSWWELLGGPAGVAAVVDHYLHMAKVHQNVVKARRDRTPGNLYDTDRAWCRQVGGIDTVLPAFVAIGQLSSARQHLRGIASLLPLDEVDIPTSALARGCCEASARAAAVIDPEVEPEERITRALNDALNSLPRGCEAVVGPREGSLVITAERLGISVRLDKVGLPMQFGTRSRPTMTTLTGQYLAEQVKLPAETFNTIWRMWNGAAHGGFDAGLGLGLGGGTEGFGGVRSAAGFAALGAFGMAQEGLLAYQGLPSLASAFGDAGDR